ncbi:hypothetical protein MA16_Dca003080 [Dendrobium catenatum]|uniref:CCHC-type domain-containing protein n=1 Tax=Dendrobium catenatum TaxID=906689 RepID=A0A2I0XBR0_9ASPA|nr:hypothetical protein MA16_Dca003080 [Dendrobium catenatum]
MGVWVDGLEGRFFQKIEYEKISTFCYKCGKIGHLKQYVNGERKLKFWQSCSSCQRKG